MLVQNGFGDTRGRGDVVHRRGVEPALRKHLTGDVEQLTAPLLGGHAQIALRGHHPAVPYTLDLSGITKRSS